MENLQPDHLTHMDLEIDGQVRQDLYEGAKWAKFISILMFVSSGFILLVALLGGTAMNGIFRSFGSKYALLGQMGGGIVIVIFLLVAAVLSFVYYFLYQFSVKVKTALISENSAEFNEGLKSLKTFFIITTVFAILSLLLSIFNIF